MPVIGLTELVCYERNEVEAWAGFFARQPHALELPFAPEEGVGSRMATVRGVVHHIVAVETRYCDRLLAVPVTPYEAIPVGSADDLFAHARDANDRLSVWLRGASDADLSRILEFQTMSAGAFRASARKVVAHTLVHGIRTWAQLATVARLHGMPTGWHHDLLFSDALLESSPVAQ